MSRRAALLRAATSPALPILLFARAVRSVAAAPGQLRVFLPAAPLVLAAMLAWSYGEASGYLRP
jgi:hypothetical protein